jgi:SagB-type dehydrogenase family enzyme
MREVIMNIHYLILTLLFIGLGANAAANNKDSLSIGPRFHYETSYNDSGTKGPEVIWTKELPLYKKYENAPKTKLPFPTVDNTDLDKIISARRSIRNYTGQSLNLAQVARLLQSADGLTHSFGKYNLRTAPSGGALYPVDIYIIASGIDSLADGLYHFQVSDSNLELIKPGDFRERIFKASFEQECVGGAPLNIILTARFTRSAKKYSDRGFRYTYMEAGAICENIYLQATALELGTVAVGAFNDDALNNLLEINGQTEAALLIMPVGYPATK